MKYVYMFSEGNMNMRELLGGKGANLAEMINIGLPVPNGFTVTTEACSNYYQNNDNLSEEIKTQILEGLKKLEQETSKIFGSSEKPLLVSVRSGARVSMPGMMDTVLNLGINDQVCETIGKNANNYSFAYDSYRRFIMMFANVVKGYEKEIFERFFDDFKEKKGLKNDLELSEQDYRKLTKEYKRIYREISGEDFPIEPKQQLLEAVSSVFRSWNNDRAVVYRKINDIPSSWGTAVNVQEMVYGNMGEASGTGVAFTRNPSTGENKLYGEYLINAQGEDVVAGVRTPKSIETLNQIMPEIYQEFKDIAKKLESYYKEMQDMEFTIENSKLYILQTRNGKRTASAAIKIAVDLVNEDLKTKEEAILSVDARSLDQLLHPVFKDEEIQNLNPIAKGLAASPGAATGKICFSAEEAIRRAKSGEKELILVRLETSPEDIEGMSSVSGIITLRGGMTSHAAVVARGMGTCCVSGCTGIEINEETSQIILKDGRILTKEDYLSCDGTTGNVYDKKLSTKDTEITGDFKTFMTWVDKLREVKVRANADTKEAALQAKSFGAEGIGLCRTEHMFFEEKRLLSFRKMIFSSTEEEREKALKEILPFQEQDFESLFEAIYPFKVNIRYLDPPLHEFLPKTEEEKQKLARDLNISLDKINQKIEELKEFNPMLGHRGCRLAITYPSIAKMQTEAVIEAAINLNKKGLKVEPEIMIPLVGIDKELEYVKDIIVETAEELINNSNINIKYSVGTMIEVPRAALISDKIALNADFFSFGTNDLTQMTYGFSRDDAGKFLNNYYKEGIFDTNPFEILDQNGVGKLIRIAIAKARTVKKDIKLGVCGEHAGDPSSISFFQKLGLDYLSCSPYRIPIAKLSLAQEVIKSKQNKK